MKCWICGKDAGGVCQFCGRAICKGHAKEMPFVLTVYDHDEDIPKAIAVSNALWCGICKPQPSPIEMPEID